MPRILHLIVEGTPKSLASVADTLARRNSLTVERVVATAHFTLTVPEGDEHEVSDVVLKLEGVNNVQLSR